MPSEVFAERILRHLQAKGYKPRRLEELCDLMDIARDEQGDFHDTCKALMKSGRIVMGSRNALIPAPPPAKVTGTYRGNIRGFGFVIPDPPASHADLYVPVGCAGGAITGDRVLAAVKKRGKRGDSMLYEGRIISIVERGQSRFVGELRRQLRKWFVVPDGQALHSPILVPDAGSKNAREGDQVVVEITRYPSEGVEARGVLVKVLGRRGRPGVDTLSIIEQYQLPGDFPKKALDEARKVVADFDESPSAEEREDLRELTTITIDPNDAKDFDDAISLTKNKDGTTELGVHIADVSHFVTPGGALDKEARERANSIYLPRVVIPMLPEVLCNGACSLQEGEMRLTKSALITYDAKGKVKRARVANTIIRSTKRLTYDQATRILDGKTGRTSAKIVSLLREMERLAKRIRGRRIREGMLVLELPERELVFDDAGTPTDVVPTDTSFSHTIIEMFMVEANEAVARLLLELKTPYLRRTHDDPKESSDGTLVRFVRALGFTIPDGPDRFALQALLDRVRGKKTAFAVNLAVLRSMQQAEYSPQIVGHYALASKHYCHFTSPIRRYPDLTIHRLIDRHIREALSRSRRRKSADDDAAVAELGTHCSARERRAESAERELRLVMTLRLMEKHVGELFEGIVTGVANVGVFVQIERYMVDGLLRFDALPDDWWEVDSPRGAVVGQRSGRKITVGDRLKVQIISVPLPTRRLELGLPTQTKAASAGRGKKVQVRATSKKHSQRTNTSKTRKVGRGRSKPPRRGSRRR
ncbi:MAG: ribonuclease R [Planctomycetes bacterium]|nr:ribonuclease R [Planctomycetota bacterium]